jgi:hypothetical protein
MPRISILLGLFGILAFAVVLTNAAKATQPSDDALYGLRMSLSPDQNAKGPRDTMQFQIEFRNVGLLPFVVATGGGCGKLAGEAASNIIIILVDAKGEVHHLPFEGSGPPYQAGCGGPTSVIQFKLDSGESRSLLMDLGKFVDLSDSKSYRMFRFPAGVYSLSASLSTTETGRAFSNSLQVRFDSEFAAPLGDFRVAN